MVSSELQTGEEVRVLSLRSRHYGRVGTVHSLTPSGLYARVKFGEERHRFKLTSLERTNPRARTVEEAMIDLAVELGRYVRIVADREEEISRVAVVPQAQAYVIVRDGSLHEQRGDDRRGAP